MLIADDDDDGEIKTTDFYTSESNEMQRVEKGQPIMRKRSRRSET